MYYNIGACSLYDVIVHSAFKVITKLRSPVIHSKEFFFSFFIVFNRRGAQHSTQVIVDSSPVILIHFELVSTMKFNILTNVIPAVDMFGVWHVVFLEFSITDENFWVFFPN